MFDQRQQSWKGTDSGREGDLEGAVTLRDMVVKDKKKAIAGKEKSK